MCSSRYSLNMIVPFTTAKSPAAEAYGDEGLAEWGIPPRADLTFELEVVEVNKRGA